MAERGTLAVGAALLSLAWLQRQSDSQNGNGTNGNGTNGTTEIQTQVGSDTATVAWRSLNDEQLFSIFKNHENAIVPADTQTGKALRTTLPKGSNYGSDMAFRTRDHWGIFPENMHLRYSIRLSEGFTVDQQMKLHAISGRGSYHNGWSEGGWGGRVSDGSNGWSARIALTDSLGLEYYIYHADMDGSFGDHFPWNRTLTPGVWHTLDFYVDMNTPGEKDGTVAGWVDGNMSLKLSGLRFRGSKSGNIAIDEFWHNLYHGGVQTSPQNQHIDLGPHELWIDQGPQR